MIKNLKIKDIVKSKKNSLQFLPKSIVSLTNNPTVFFRGKQLKTSYLIDIIHNLLLRYYFKKENEFNLSSIILKEKYGYQYNYYMGYLVHINVIQVVKNYLKGKNARVYKISQNIIDEQILRYRNDDTTLLKKYKKAVSLIDTTDVVDNSIYPEVKQRIVSDLFDVEIEIDKAIYYLDYTKQDLDSYNKNKYSVESIHDKHIFYHFDSYGRVHTNFTILKSYIRKNCLLMGGEETFEIDISNSQPLFLAKIINEEGIFINQHEFKVFGNLVLKGNFYQFLINNSDIKDKKECKEVVYRTFFGRNATSARNPIAKLFPTIYKFITDYKSEYENYKILAHKLQNEESNFIFNKVIKTIMVIDPNISTVTIHDSIIVKKKYQDIVENVLNSLLEKEFDFIDKNYVF
jgi:hypothetical protein